MVDTPNLKFNGFNSPFSKPAPLRKFLTTVELVPGAKHQQTLMESLSPIHENKLVASPTNNLETKVALNTKPAPLKRQKTAPDTVGPNWRTKTAVIQPSKLSELRRQKSSLLDDLSQSRETTSTSDSFNRGTRSRDSCPVSESITNNRSYSSTNNGEAILRTIAARSQFRDLPLDLYIHPDSLTVDYDDDQEALVLGEGAQDQKVAVKMSCSYRILEEFQLTYQLRHARIIRPIAFSVALTPASSSSISWEDSDESSGSAYENAVTFMAIYEYCPHGDLASYLQKFPEKSRDSQYMSQVFDNILEALEAVHQKGYLHTDIKPENILVAEDGSVRLADFGMCQRFSDRMIAQGTPSYLPPEMVAAWHTHYESHRYTPGADLFSFGVLLVNTVTDKYPFARLTARLRRGISLVQRELKEIFTPPIRCFQELYAINPKFATIAKLCLRVDPLARTDAEFLRKILSA